MIHHAHTSRQLLAYVIVASGVLSAIFLNDTIVLVFTPLVLDLCLALNVRPIPYLVALVTGHQHRLGGDDHRQPAEHADRRGVGDFLQHLHALPGAGGAGRAARDLAGRHLHFRRDFGGRLVKEPVVRLRTESALLHKSLLTV